MARERLMVVRLLPSTPTDRPTTTLEKLVFKKGTRESIRGDEVFPMDSVQGTIDVVVTKTGVIDTHYDAVVPGLDAVWGKGSNPSRALTDMGAAIIGFHESRSSDTDTEPSHQLSWNIIRAKLDLPPASQE